MMLYLTHINIFVEFQCNTRNDMKRIEYILGKANEAIKKQEEHDAGHNQDIEEEEKPLVEKKPCLTHTPKKPKDPSMEIVKLDLQSDIYSYTYFVIWGDSNHYRHAELMIKCFLTIIIQLSLIYLRFTEAISSDVPLVPGTPELNIIRLTSAFFMHIQLYPEIKISLEMIKYSIFN